MAGNGNYHIYIHQTKEIIHKKVVTQKPSSFSAPTSGGGNTTPRAPSGSGDEEGGGLNYVPRQVPGAGVYNGAIRIAKGFSSGASAGGVIAAIVAIVKATEACQKAAGKMNDYVATATGDYTRSIWHSNLASGHSVLMHPISSTWQAGQTEASWYRANQRIEEQRALLGDSAINTLTKGV